MANIVTGKVEQVSQKFSGGVKINGTWYNGTKASEQFVKAAQKDKVYDLELNEKGYIASIRSHSVSAGPSATAKEDPIARLVSGRQTALNCATNMTVALIQAGKITLKENESYATTATEVAKIFEKHLFRSPHEDQDTEEDFFEGDPTHE